MGKFLSKEQLNQYWELGYIVLPDLISKADIDTYEKRFITIIESADHPDPPMKIMRDIMFVKKAVTAQSRIGEVNKLVNFENDEIMFRYTTQTKLVRAVQELIGKEIYSIATNLFNKPPGIDGRHPLHQDLRYFRIRPPGGIIGTWTSIGSATRKSGCLAVIPGSHRGPLKPHSNPAWEHVNTGFYGIDVSELSEHIYVETNPGDTILFHPLLIHGSGRNRTDTFRRALSSHYASGKCWQPGKNWKSADRVRYIVETF
mgnify:CR=1 FL=1